MTDPTPPPTRPSPDWLFKDGGQLYGPVSEERFLALAEGGKVIASTEVSPGGGAFARADSFPALLLPLEKARVRVRVHAEVERSNRLGRRRRALRWTLLSAAGAAVVLLAIGLAWYLAVKRPWRTESELLADLGGGIAVGAVHVGAGRARDLELSVPDPAAAPPPVSRPKRVQSSRPARASAPLAAAGADDLLVRAHYDPARIQEVVAQRRGTLAGCFREEAARSPELSGEIPIEFAIGNDGRLAALWIDEPRVRSGPLRDCLLERLRSWSFDPFTGERPVVSLAFRIGPR